jgi:RimJ/RimL family protein N-acetyltransferase
MFGPALTGPRLALGPPSVRDIPRLERWLGDPEITRYWWTRDVPWAKRPAIAALVLFAGGLRPNAILWIIAHDGQSIGFCLIRQIDRTKRHATVAVLIGERSAHGKGFGAEACAIRNEFVFGRLDFESLRATALAENTASRRLLERSGYRLIGNGKGAAAAGREQDVLLFELTRSDYARLRATGD